MATALDTRLIPRIFAIIEKYGLDASFHNATYRYSAQTSTGSEGTFPPATDVTRKIVPPFPAVDAFIPNDLIRGGSMVTYVAAQGLTITLVPGMKVVIATKTYVISSVDTIRTGELPALYQLILD